MLKSVPLRALHFVFVLFCTEWRVSFTMAVLPSFLSTPATFIKRNSVAAFAPVARQIGNPLWFRRFAWGMLGYNILVMLWGAYVRASKSGDGCGSHWPTCNGEIIPVAPAIKTMIEFGHRLSIVALMPLLFALLIVGYCTYPPKHRVRLGLSLCIFFTFVEALIGAGLVLFKLVAHNESVYRVIALSAHLVNNLFLLTVLTLTAYWASGGPALRLKGQGKTGTMIYVSLVGTIVMAVTGAIAALGDTIYKTDSLISGLRDDFAADASFILRHRPLHPFAAILVTVGVILVAQRLSQVQPSIIWRARRVQWLFVAQTVVGLVNLVMLAPIWLQISHLLLADLLWINLILFFASALAQEEPLAADEPALLNPSFPRAEMSPVWPINSPSRP